MTKGTRDVPLPVGSDKGHAAACPYMWDAFLLRVDQAVGLRGEFLDHVAGDAV